MRAVLCMQESLPTPQKYQHQGRGHSWCSVLLLFLQKKMYYCQKNWCKFYSAKSSPHGHCQREKAALASLTGVDRFMTRNRRPRSKSNYQTGPHPSCLLVVDRLNSGSVLFLTGSGPLQVQRACHAWLGGLATTGLHQAALHLLP